MIRIEAPARAAGDQLRTVAEARIVEHLLVCGWVREYRRGDAALARIEAGSTLNRWVDAGLPFALAPDGERRFDPAEVFNFFCWAGEFHGDAFWRSRFVDNHRARVRDFHPGNSVADAPPAHCALEPRRFSITLHREFDLAYFSRGADTILRLPLPIEDEALSGLEVEAVVPPGLADEIRIAAGRMDVRVPAGSAVRVEIGARIAFTASAHAARSPSVRLTPGDRELYTRPTEGLVRVDARVRALARRLAGDGRDPAAAARRFWEYLLDETIFGIVDYARVDPAAPFEHVLDSGWLDCQMGAALMVAMCRSLGIPARIVAGHLIYPLCPSQHWWMEYWQDDLGWSPVDTLASDLSARGRDAPWRDCFLGQLDFRMKSEILPRHFSRSPGLRLPTAWRMLSRLDGDANEISLIDCATAAPVYRDRIAVRQQVPG